jgi:hypothetical protein
MKRKKPRETEATHFTTPTRIGELHTLLDILHFLILYTKPR